LNTETNRILTIILEKIRPKGKNLVVRLKGFNSSPTPFSIEFKVTPVQKKRNVNVSIEEIRK